MNDLDEILRWHMRRYPDMRARDAMKLIYQRVFGCGHLVTDFEDCLSRVRDESLSCAPGGTLFEPLGNGYARLYLGTARAQGVSPWLIARLFYLSAKRRRGDQELFLREAERAKAFFDAREIDALIAESVEGSFAPFSHSAAYREAYHPAYRVVLSSFERILPLFREIDKRRPAAPVAVAVDGRCGAGKTTLAASLSEVFDCPVVHMDDFFLPPDLRTTERLSAPGGNIHIERFLDEIAPHIGRGEAFSYGVFDCGQGAVTRRREIPASDVLIVEGSYSLHPGIAGLYGVKAFCDIGGTAQLARLKERDPARVNDFIQRWIPMEEKYFGAFGVKESCDFILSADK